jgi:hypothetical protein
VPERAVTRQDPPGGATRLDPEQVTTGMDGAEEGHGSLVNLPAALAERFEIERPLPAPGAEADLLLVRARQDGGALRSQGLPLRHPTQERGVGGRQSQ